MATRYRGVIEEHVAMQSARKGTPGIEFRVRLAERWDETNAQWLATGTCYRRVWLWFPPNVSNEWNMKKLAFAGYRGGGLSAMDLVGNACEVESSDDTYNGEQTVRWELALPSQTKTEASADAFLAIDAVLQSEPVPKVVAALLPKSLDAADAVERIADVVERAGNPPSPPRPDDGTPF